LTLLAGLRHAFEARSMNLLSLLAFISTKEVQILTHLAGLRHAFEARDMNSLVQKILRANYAPIPSTASKDVRELVKSMLALAPGRSRALIEP
jgi:hypothetical protein